MRTPDGQERPIIQSPHDKKLSSLEDACECGGQEFAYNVFWHKRICISCRQTTEIRPEIWVEIRKEQSDG